MSEGSKPDIVSRRGFLGMGSAALAAAGMLPAADTLAQDQKPYPSKEDRSASAPGPGNPPLDTQNSDSFLPPPSDAGGVQTFKYPFALSHKRMQEEVGLAKSPSASWRFPNRSPAWTCD